MAWSFPDLQHPLGTVGGKPVVGFYYISRFNPNGTAPADWQFRMCVRTKVAEDRRQQEVEDALFGRRPR